MTWVATLRNFTAMWIDRSHASELDGFVDALAVRIASFDKQAIAITRTLGLKRHRGAAEAHQHIW
jgi:hypothetical protein